ncbi:MAG: DUF6754 domain-containing protein [bacterium]
MKSKLILIILLLTFSLFISAQNDSDSIKTEFDFCSIESVNVRDCENDDGTALIVEWQLRENASRFDGTYSLYRVNQLTGDTTIVKPGIVSETMFTDELLSRKGEYSYFIVNVNEDGIESTQPVTSMPVSPQANWFKKDKTILLLMIIAYMGLIIFFVQAVRRGREFFLRKISGLDALDEAVGRATEMGKPILYVPGLSTMSDIATIASLNILGPVAKKVAEYESRIIVPNRDPIVMTVAKEVVKEAYTEAGRPDAYDENDVFFLTSSQFGYAAAVNGIMVREKPATNLFLGMFWAESLILSETGNTTGAIQIAGTDAVTQLPFFITSCDYTIIGEELYAASAYLSGEPVLMGSIKAQDYLKAFLLLFLLVFFVVFIIYGIMGQDVKFLETIMEYLRFIFNT